MRGIAIGAVLLSHVLGGMGLAPPDGAVVALGRFGVTLFFILSGYLIFRSVESEPLGTFSARRFFKVMLAYWLNILAILALDVTLTDAAHPPWQSYVSDALAVSDVLRRTPVSGVLWTLFIEIKFYILIAVLHVCFGRRHLWFSFAALLAVEAGAWLWRGQGSQTLAFFPVFYAGMAIALAEEGNWNRAATWRVAVLTVVIAVSLGLFLNQLRAWSAAALIAAVAVFLLFRLRAWSNPILGFLGETSYSTYLYHSLVVAALFEALAFGRTPAGMALALITGLGLAVGTGAILYRLVEVTSVRWGRRLERHLT